MTLAELLKAIESGKTTTAHAEAVRWMADVVESYFRGAGFYDLADRWQSATAFIPVYPPTPPAEAV